MTLNPDEFRDDLLYVLVFGPGYGESILVRAPPGKWLAVDSVRSQRGGTDVMPAVDLLLAADAELSLAVMSHPHRDHARGFSQLLDLREPGSPVGCLPGFLGLAQDARRNPDAAEVLDEGSIAAALNRIDHIWRTEDETRWDLLAGSNRPLGDALVESLFPPSMPNTLPSDLNKVSSPLTINWRDCGVVLGADLLRAGWTRIAKTDAAPSIRAAQHLKASHHGSRGAQHEIAVGSPPTRDRSPVVTPYNRGKKLPRYEDGHGIEQLLDANAEVAITAMSPPARGNRSKRSALAPVRQSFGGALTLEYEPTPPSPAAAWHLSAFDGRGDLVEARAGDAAGWVVP